jgi:hypothetical protein
MNVPVCPRCWCPHTMARPCGVSAGTTSPVWHGGREEQSIADRAELIAIDRFLRERRVR